MTPVLLENSHFLYKIEILICHLIFMKLISDSTYIFVLSTIFEYLYCFLQVYKFPLCPLPHEVCPLPACLCTRQ